MEATGGTSKSSTLPLSQRSQRASRKRPAGPDGSPENIEPPLKTSRVSLANATVTAAPAPIALPAPATIVDDEEEFDEEEAAVPPVVPQALPPISDCPSYHGISRTTADRFLTHILEGSSPMYLALLNQGRLVQDPVPSALIMCTHDDLIRERDPERTHITRLTTPEGVDVPVLRYRYYQNLSYQTIRHVVRCTEEIIALPPYEIAGDLLALRDGSLPIAPFTDTQLVVLDALAPTLRTVFSQSDAMTVLQAAKDLTSFLVSKRKEGLATLEVAEMRKDSTSAESPMVSVQLRNLLRARNLGAVRAMNEATFLETLRAADFGAACHLLGLRGCHTPLYTVGSIKNLAMSQDGKMAELRPIEEVAPGSRAICSPGLVTANSLMGMSIVRLLVTDDIGPVQLFLPRQQKGKVTRYDQGPLFPTVPAEWFKILLEKKNERDGTEARPKKLPAGAPTGRFDPCKD